jgi:ribA/ribD-fused uncharacterized protein
MKETIAFTKVALPFGWLGNMAPYPVTWEGREWRTTEALFQALRFSDEEIREKIREQKSPMSAKMVSKPFADRRVVEVGSAQDIENMKLCIQLKLEQHPQLQQELSKTGDKLIVEDVTSRGARGTNLLWGSLQKDGEWHGQNVLGHLWMQARDKLNDINNETKGI